MTSVQKLGSEILVNTTTTGDQFAGPATALPNGGFAVVWMDSSHLDGDSSETAIKLQLFDADGDRHGIEILVNTTTPQAQNAPQVTPLANGGLVVTWSDNSGLNGDSSPGCVRAQVFDADGGKVGSEILVNTTTLSNQDASQVIGLTNGGFAVCWMDNSLQGGDNSGPSVRAQVFAADGSKIGGEILVNSTTQGTQQEPHMTSLEGGGFVVVWQDSSAFGQGDDRVDIRGQVFTASGVPLGGEFLVNTTTVGDQHSTELTALEGGGFAVTWSDNSHQNGDDDGSIRAQVFDSSGQKSGSEILVNDITDGSQGNSKIAALVGGGFAISWTDVSGLNGDSDSSVAAQVFDADGNKVGTQILVNTTTAGDQGNGSLVAGLANGMFVVAWRDDAQFSPPDGASVRAQVFDASGAKFGPEFLVNSTTFGEQALSRIVALPDGGFFVTWSDASHQNGDSSGYSVRAQVFTFAQTVSINEGGSTSGNVLVEIFDPSEGPYDSVSIYNNGGDNQIAGLYGTLTLQSDGIYSYTADLAAALALDSTQNGVDAFTFTALTENGESITKVLTFDVLGLDTVINGTDSSETLLGTTGRDIIFGEGGADVIDGKAGIDTMFGGLGNDTFTVDSIGDVVTEFENEGVDLVRSTVSYVLADDVENLTLLGTSNIDGTGNAAANVITGNDGNNILDGDAGIDRLTGGKGDDTYIVDLATDVVTEVAGAGTDTVRSTAANYTLATNVENLILLEGAVNGTGNVSNNVITGNDEANRLDGGAGNDTLDGGLGVDMLIGGAGNDTFSVDDPGDVVTELSSGGTDTVLSSASNYTLSANVENLTLLAGAVNGTGNVSNNIIVGNGQSNTINGGAGNDTITGGLGDDSLNGDLGIDTVSYTDAAGAVVVSLASALSQNTQGAGLDILAGFENVTGSDFSDTLTGDGIANTIRGGKGHDTINGNAAGAGAADALIGGEGNDTYIVHNTGDAITELSGEGTDTAFSDAASYTLANNVEHLTLTGIGNISGTGNGLNNALNGNAGNNTLNGGAGNDVLDGHAGNDSLAGGAGNDIYYVDSATDVIVESSSAGTDLAYSQSAAYTLSANVENLTLLSGATNATGNASGNVIIGNDNANILNGLDGNDTLDGGTGIDTLIGGKGGDTYHVDNVNETVTESAGEGTDTVYSSAASFTLAVNVENLVLKVGAGDATGNAGANLITGNAAANVITGLAGNDTLTGGGGADTFVFGAGSGKDRVTDFAPGAGPDVIQFVSGQFVDFADLLAHAANKSGSVVITSGSDTLTLVGVKADQLSANDFLFS